MQVHGSIPKDAQVTFEFTGAELKKFYSEADEYFICNAIGWVFSNEFKVQRYPASEQVIKALRAAVPARFKKGDASSAKNVLGPWMLPKYNTGNERANLMKVIPDDHVFQIVMHTTRQG